jgi:hypothetical protein
MATFYSTEYTTHRDGPDKNAPHTNNGVVYEYAHFTGQALSSSDSVELMKIPSGVRILPQSFIIISDLESSATVNVGYAAHTAQTDGSAVAVDADAFCSAIAADSARTVTHFHESGTHDTGYVTTGELVLTLALGAGTAVSADTFDVHIMYCKG